MSNDDLSLAPREATCPACGHHVAVPMLTEDTQPLATIAWPESAAAAAAMDRLPLAFVRCTDCGHVYNAAFRYDLVPYSDKPNLMFNRGALWSAFIDNVRRQMLQRLPERPVVVEIGHGDASFLDSLAQARPEGRYIGFDPKGATAGGNALDLRAELFDPVRHLAELRPDLIVSRHVLEHLTNPLGFLQRIAFAAARSGVVPLAYFEVPCIDRALQTGRTVDFYYEHSSQFTTESFARMLTRCSASIEQIGTGYDGEVIFAFVRLSGTMTHVARAAETERYLRAADVARDTVAGQLAGLLAAGRSIAFWGGTGKSAAFINRYGIDATRYPIVVDSDLAKVGTFVPGTGQEIRFRDWLIGHPADVVVVPPQWRAADICLEMDRHGIHAELVLIEHQGRLIDFHHDDHPYAR